MSVLVWTYRDVMVGAGKIKEIVSGSFTSERSAVSDIGKKEVRRNERRKSE